MKHLIRLANFCFTHADAIVLSGVASSLGEFTWECVVVGSCVGVLCSCCKIRYAREVIE